MFNCRPFRLSRLPIPATTANFCSFVYECTTVIHLRLPRFSSGVSGSNVDAMLLRNQLGAKLPTQLWAFVLSTQGVVECCAGRSWGSQSIGAGIDSINRLTQARATTTVEGCD